MVKYCLRAVVKNRSKALNEDADEFREMADFYADTDEVAMATANEKVKDRMKDAETADLSDVSRVTLLRVIPFTPSF